MINPETINQDIEWLNIHNQMINADQKENTDQKENNDENNILDVEPSLIKPNLNENSKLEIKNDLDYKNQDINQSFIEGNTSIDDMLKDIIIDEELPKETKDYSKMTVSQLQQNMQRR